MSEKSIISQGSSQKFHHDLHQRVLRGGVWVVAIRIVVQILSFAKWIVLAWKLDVADIGLLGLAMLLIQTLNAFSQTGFQVALIQKKGCIKEYFDSAWTFGLIRAILLYLLLFAIAPYATLVKAPVSSINMSNVAMAPLVIRVMGLSILINSLSNIGIIYFKKNLQFHKQFILEITSTLVGVVATLVIVFIWPSVWAFVIGILTTNLLSCATSYMLSDYRPAISFDSKKITEMWLYGKWVFVFTVFVFLITQGDDFFVWSYLGWAYLAYYQMAYKLSSMPAIELTNMISQVTFPAYSIIQDDVIRVKLAYLKILKLTGLISFLVGGLVGVLSLDFVLLFLQDKWIPIIVPMQLLAVFTILRPLKAGVQAVIMALGRPKISAFMAVTKLLVLALLIWPCTSRWKITGTVLAVLISSIISIPFDMFFLKKILKCRMGEVLGTQVIQLISLLAMLLVMSYARLYIFEQVSFVEFLLLGLTGVLVYSTVIYISDMIFHTGLVNILKQQVNAIRR